MTLNTIQFQCRNSSQSCLEIARAQKAPLKNRYYLIYNDNSCNQGYPRHFFVYCDFTSQPGYAWTLIESFSRDNRYHNSINHAFTGDYSVNSDSPDQHWALYRMSRSRMLSIYNRDRSLTSQPLWRATCNFASLPRPFPPSPTDIIYSSFTNVDILNFFSGRCVTLDYANICGSVGKSSSYFLYADRLTHLYIPAFYSASVCGKRILGGNGWDHIWDEYFGAYDSYNAGFSCTKSGNSTTNWWIGAKIH